nr:hypothetical protein [Tanacetum cinerariifolium]
MARLQFCDYHNMVAILEKSENNVDFHPIVDFVEASTLRYALTFKPIVYVSHIRQFWSTARIETTKEGTKILATMDGILRTVTESSLRRNLKLQDEEGINELTSPLRDVSQGEACPTNSGFIADQDRETIAKSSTLPHDSAPRVTFPAADEGSMQQRIYELTELYTSLQRQQSQMAAKIKDQDHEISELKVRVKFLEDKESRSVEPTKEDAPITGGIMEIREKLGADKSTELGSNDTEEMVNVLSSIEAANILTSGGATASVSPGDVLPTVGVPTVSGSFPTESLSNRQPTSDKEMELWVELKRLYKPDDEDQLWTYTQKFMYAPVEWKLYDMFGVHQVTSMDKEIFMLVEKDYPLKKGLALVMICYKFQGRIVGNKMHKAFSLPVIEFLVAKEVPTVSEESSHCQKKRDATAKRIVLLGSMQQTINKLTALCTILQRQHSEMIAKFEAQEVEINMLKAIVKLLEDREGVAAERSGDDAPIKGRNLDEGEASAERVSDDTEEMETVLTSMDATTVLASGVVEVPTSSGSIPTAGPPTAEVPTGSDVVPTASPVFATATVIDAQVARELEEQLEREDHRMSEQIAKDAEVARIHVEEELQSMIDGLDRSNETKKRDYYMAVIRSNLGWKVKDFKGMYFEEIKEKFTIVWKQLEDFIPMGSKEEAERLKRKGLSLEQESAKKLKPSDEVPEENSKNNLTMNLMMNLMKNHLMRNVLMKNDPVDTSMHGGLMVTLELSSLLLTSYAPCYAGYGKVDQKELHVLVE